MARSVNTVPNALLKGIFSYLANTPHRLTSPRRGNARLAKYPMKTAKNTLMKLTVKGVWGPRRELPKLASKSFNELWKEREKDSE